MARYTFPRGGHEVGESAQRRKSFFFVSRPVPVVARGDMNLLRAILPVSSFAFVIAAAACSGSIAPVLTSTDAGDAGPVPSGDGGKVDCVSAGGSCTFISDCAPGKGQLGASKYTCGDGTSAPGTNLCCFKPPTACALEADFECCGPFTTRPNCEDGKLVCLPGFTRAPTGTCTAAKVCTTDPECNADVAQSSLAGKCEANGTCTCNGGNTKTPAGKCASPTANTCIVAGGSCGAISECSRGSGQLGGSDYSCGGGAAGTNECCFKPPTPCGTEADFDCCMPNDAVKRPTCVAGKLQCPSAATKAEVGKCMGG